MHGKLDAQREVRVDRMVAAGLTEKVARRRQHKTSSVDTPFEATVTVP